MLAHILAIWGFDCVPEKKMKREKKYVSFDVGSCCMNGLDSLLILGASKLENLSFKAYISTEAKVRLE